MKLDPLGVNADVDNVRLTANNKANVCAAVQLAYDRAQQTAVVSCDETLPAPPADGTQQSTDT